jgi:outer membrane protein OmpA-like peptidoglycan-associated protein
MDDDGGRAGETDDETLIELRSLLVGPDINELRAFRARLADPAARTRDVSAVLADAIAQRAHDPQLARALAPPVEEAITASVRRDPQPLADALFPAIGPAIRKAIAHTLSSMMESLNRTVEQSVSWRAVQWRWTALRTGKPFAEVVLLNTLHYRVEHVYLIHRETGLLLQHVAYDPRAAHDADQISAMLTAISDFVRDSFNVNTLESVDAMQVGELTVFVEQGPQALLACVVRGTAPAELRAIMQDALERVHRQLGEELDSFRGDSAAFERARPVLESCLVSHFRTPDKPRSYRGWLAAAAALLVLLGVWTFFTVRERQRWNAYVDRLAAEPGLTVVSSGRRGGKFFVAGLRDPLAADPATFLAGSGLDPGSIESRWEPYQALQPAFVSARAIDLLRPPATVSLSYRDGVLTASGKASERWIAESERLAPAIAGVRRFNYTGARGDLELKARIEAATLLFPKGRATLAPGQDGTATEIAALLRDLNEVLRVRGRRAQVDVIGHTDSDGSETSNEALSRARADAVVSLFRAHPLDALDIRTTGIGSAAPLVQSVEEEGKRRNRRVSFRVRLAEVPEAPGRQP